jgi:hypothetical protein
MAEKTFDEMVDETGDKIEELFEGMLTPKQKVIYWDIRTLIVYRSQTEHNEHSTNQTIEAMGSCNAVLEYGDRIIAPIKPTFLDPPLDKFGAN